MGTSGGECRCAGDHPTHSLVDVESGRYRVIQACWLRRGTWRSLPRLQPHWWEEAKNVRSNPDSFMGRHTGIARLARPSRSLAAGVLRGVETVGNIAARKDGRSSRLKRPLRDYARKGRVRHRNPLPGLGP